MPAIDLKEALADAISGPDLIRRMEAFAARVPSTFLLIYPFVFVFAVLSHQTQIATYVRASDVLTV